MILAATQIYSSHGGIPSYMRRLAEIFSVISNERDVPFSAVSLIDSDWEPERHSNIVRYSEFIGASASRLKFLRQLVGLCWENPHQTLLLGHVCLAPLGYILRSVKLIRSYVVVLHGIEAWGKLRVAERIACRVADSIVGTTTYTKEVFGAANRVDSNRISVIPLAIEHTSSADIRVSHKANGSLRLLFVGRLNSQERYKGLDEVLHAIAKLSAESIDLQLKVVGTGDDLTRFVSVAQSLGISHLTDFAGTLSNEQLKAAYQDCDVFVMPSRGEGFGIAFLEAMSYGKPCLGARSGGVPEVIEDGRDGLLVRYGDVGHIAHSLRLLANDRGLLLRLGVTAGAKVHQKYMFGNMLANWRELLSSVLDDEDVNTSKLLCAE